MRKPSGQPWRAQSQALALAIGWMVLAQVACGLLWDAGVLTRPAALLHWLVVGVLPPGLAMWGMGQAAPQR